MRWRSGVEVDFGRLFDAVPTALLVLDLRLRVVEANPAYCVLLGRRREELVGRQMAELFPDNPDDGAAGGLSAVIASLTSVRETGEVSSVPLQRHDIFDPDTEVYVERYWSIVNAPVLDEDGAVVLLLNRVEDVSAYAAAVGGGERSQRIVRAESEVYERSRELQAAWAAQAEASRRVAALTGVALAVSTAETVADVTELVVQRGVMALGASRGTVAVLDDDGLALTVTDSQTRTTGALLPLSDPLPASVATAAGQRVLLPDEAASLAFAPEMAEVLRGSGCPAWAAFPLRAGGAVIGALTVGRSQARTFPDDEVDLLEAFAAQCAQGIARIRNRQAERAVAVQDRNMAETLQLSLLTPPAQPDHLQLAVRYRPAAAGARVGGDWYDAFLTPTAELCLVIGDVAGHDREAVAVMGQVRNLLRGLTFGLDAAPSAVLTAVDRAMRHFAVGLMATAVMAQIDQTPDEAAQSLRTFRWSNAGHLPPLLLHPDGTAELLSTRPEPLLGIGLSDVVPLTDHEVPLPIGSTVVLYTDGLVERRGSDLDQDLDRLLATAQAVKADSLEDWCDELIDRMEYGGADDVAVLALRAHDEGEPRPPEAGPERLR